MPDMPTSAGTFGIEVVGMTKRFGAFVALDDISMKVSPGHFHALLGENGAGKSTLVKCIMGYHRPDEGVVIVGDREITINNPRAAHALGLGMVYQHFTLVPALTVAENLVMSRTELPLVFDWGRENELLESFLAHMPFRVPLGARVSALSAGERQKCEILKQLYLERRFLILDEPTSVLTPQEADEVLGMLRAMVERREITVLMITHKFREVMAFADRVTILRRGRVAAQGSVDALTPDEMARTMIGAETLTVKPARTGTMGGPRLEIRHLAVSDDGGKRAVDDLSLTVCGGEIVGVAGVSGNGQSELVEALAGQRQKDDGEIRIGGESFDATREQMHRHKISCLPDEPLRNACVGRMSVAENLAFRSFDRPPYAASGLWLRPDRMRIEADKKIQQYRIRTRSADAALMTLSGGNVQRAVLARELDDRIEVMIASNPCFGLDFAAVAQIHAEIIAARNRGAAVLLVSNDLDEILEMSDRIVVMFNGHVVHDTRIEGADLTEIGRYMAGH